MLFNSVGFLFFFPIVTIVYYLLAHKYRWIWLLAASCYFYMAFVPIYIIILGGTIVIDYFAGIWIAKTNDYKKRKLFVVLSLISNIGVLAFFKYFNFLNENLTSLLHGVGYKNPVPFLSILLPIGLSFHTFQAMSYTIEVYRGNQTSEKHFGIYALYVMFYPQLVAGPIERPQNMLHQFHEKREYNYENIRKGICQMVWGLFKKMVIADRLGLFVNQVYDNPHSYQGLPLIIATVFFAFQIYCDFSGYSDIALGAARTMGYKLMLNFNYPFTSTSVSEFWRKWHISLSTWFSDYLFNPLVIGTRKWAKTGVCFALMTTLLISGLWHGAGWNFVVFGGLHGLAMTYEFLTKRIRKKVSKALPHWLYDNLSVVLTFSFACFAWVFFRANNLTDALYIGSHLFSNIGTQFYSLLNRSLAVDKLVYLNQGKVVFFFSVFLIILLGVIQTVIRKNNILDWMAAKNVVIRYSIYYSVALSILIFGVLSGAKFIYFQF